MIAPLRTVDHAHCPPIHATTPRKHLAALVLLGLDGRLPTLAAWAVPGTLVTLAAAALVRQQRAPSMLDQPARPPLPERYRVADDPAAPLAEVIAAAERDAARAQ